MRMLVAAIIEDDDIQKPDDYLVAELIPNVKDFTFNCQSIEQVRSAPAMNYAINSMLDMMDVLPGMTVINGSSTHEAQKIVAQMKNNERWSRVISMLRNAIKPLKPLKDQGMNELTRRAEEYVLGEIFYKIPKVYDFQRVHDTLYDMSADSDLPLGLEACDRFRHYTPQAIMRYMVEARDRLVVTMCGLTTSQ